MSINVVILAAGKGTRMKSDLPKVLHRVAGKPMLQHVVSTARSLNATRICVVIGHGAEQVGAAMQSEVQHGLTVALQAEQRGTGHALMQALPHIAPELPTLVLYGDVPLISPASLARLMDKAQGQDVAVLTVTMRNPQGYGRIVRDEQGLIARIVEQKDASEAEKAIHEVNTGILVLPPGGPERWLSMLTNTNAAGEYYLTDVVSLARADGVAVHAVPAANEPEVQGVNSPLELAQIERAYQWRQALALMQQQGVRLTDPARFDLRGKLTCGKDVSIDVNCVFEGDVVLGDGVSVGANCVIKDAVIASQAQIKPFTHIDSAVVGKNAQIGPFARLRPGAQLGDEVHIGNFVEVKNSTMARGSKANHLAYLGDATVGERVNYGAGCITANYDGANKHQTIIEADAHVGSNSVLVAPVTIGAAGTIGAGSVIAKDTPPAQLTVARARQLSMAGWKRPTKKK
jgi:bifunctional UDP-N-acetylglucosamine pyrophosphorylase / glucosamine-1-phosphate N-acetyltransferase